MNPDFDVRAILGLLTRHVRLIVATVLLVVAVAGLSLFALKPIYSASTLILVDPSRKDLLDPAAETTNSGSDSARVDSEVELVKSETTLLRAVGDLNLVNDPEFGVSLSLKDTMLAFLRIAQPALPTGEQALQTVMGHLRDSLIVQRRGFTYLITIQARSLQPENAARIANAVADAYIREQLEAKISSTLASRDIISGRIADASATVSKSEAALDDFISQNLDKISTETGRTDLLELRRQLESANANRSQAAAVAQLADSSLARRDWKALAQTLQSQAIAKLEEDRATLEASLAGVVEGSQSAIDLQTELSALDTELNATATSAIGSMRQQVTAAQAQASELRGQLRSSVLDADLPAEVLTSIYELQQNAEIARSQYQTLLARQKDLDAQSFLQVADSRVASEALPPGNPSFPNPTQILGFALGIGLVLGVGLAFLVENYVGGFTSEGQLRSVLRTSVVASVPRQGALKLKGGSDSRSLAEYVALSPLSAFAEAIRRIRIGLDHAILRSRKQSQSSGGTVIMVSSAAPNEGKTTISLSLARAYALSGQATLLIDCDLRKPSIHRQLGIEPSTGLLEYLAAGQEEAPPLASILTIDPASPAQIIVGARRSDVATDQLITGDRFSRLIAAARENFDVVILDTPPVGPVVDGLYLSQFADVIAFVILWSVTSQQEARSAIFALSEVKRDETEIVALLNQQKATGANYRKYAGYYSEAT
jgi:succinoglycan biosynthesis transport protein ExoP